MAISIKVTTFRHRLRWLSLVVTIVYAVLVLRLVFLQGFQGAHFRAEAAKVGSKQIPVYGTRGDILDTNGRGLNVTTYTAALVCDPHIVKAPAATADAVSKLTGARPDALMPALTNRNFPDGSERHYSVLIKELTPEMVERIQTVRDTDGPAGALAGVAIVEQTHRSHTMGPEAVHVAGYVSPGEKGMPVGVAGVELRLDEHLRGGARKAKVELDGLGRIVPGSGDGRPDTLNGGSVRLTIDSAVQHIAYSELRKCVEEHNPKGACVVVLEPASGAVSALVSYPTFDPGKPRDSTLVAGQAMANMALIPYEPGSTAKPFTVAAGLQEGCITSNTEFNCPGERSIGGRMTRCPRHGGDRAHGTLTPLKVVAKSCNIATALVGMRLGMERMEEYLHRFGLIESTRVGLPGEHSGTLDGDPKRRERDNAKLTRCSYGQSVTTTPLALAQGYGILANGGKLMQTHVVRALYDRDGKLVSETRPTALRQVVSPEVASKVTSYLRACVTEGTGKRAAVPGFTVAGKTGTAQKVVPNIRGYAPGKYVASFAGYLPATRPRAVVLVVIDEPVNGYYGSDVAAPVFKRIAQRLMLHWKVKPDDPGSLALAARG